MNHSSVVPAVTPAFHRPSPFEVVTSWVHGVEPLTPLPQSGVSPRAALEAAVRPALENPPCFVAFSGGRDSSAVLAVATHVARRDGLAEPIPVTEIYPGIAEADESRWQELVLDHLDLSRRQWIKVQHADGSDLLGEAARASLHRRGLLWPAAFHLKDPLFAPMTQGSLLTGEGGDESIGPRRITPLTLLLCKRRRPRRALLTSSAAALAPVPVRRSRLRAQMRRTATHTWLRPEVATEHDRLLAADEAAEPLSWDVSIWWSIHRRAVRAVVANYAAMGADHDVHVYHPLMDEGFLAALARAGGRWGYAGRTDLMRRLFADVLPDEILRRSTKASFDRAYMGRSTREFAVGWDGSGVDPELVDPDELRRVWCADQPTTFSAVALHAAWLAGNARQPTSTTGGGS